jgi:hypothetical protein
MIKARCRHRQREEVACEHGFAERQDRESREFSSRLPPVRAIESFDAVKVLVNEWFPTTPGETGNGELNIIECDTACFGFEQSWDGLHQSPNALVEPDCRSHAPMEPGL